MKRRVDILCGSEPNNSQRFCLHEAWFVLIDSLPFIYFVWTKLLVVFVFAGFVVSRSKVIFSGFQVYPASE